MIYGFMGQKRSGKDTAGQILKNKGYFHYSFAQPLKKLASEITILPIELFTDDRYKDESFSSPYVFGTANVRILIMLIKEDLGYSLTPQQIDNIRLSLEGKDFTTPRQILQYLGTDVCKKFVSDTIWVELFFRKASKGDVVITDVRFDNEVEAIKKAGGRVIGIQRPETDNPNPVHASEMINYSICDSLVINDSSLEEFLEKVNGAL